jgi:hypothetical protein
MKRGGPLQRRTALKQGTSTLKRSELKRRASVLKTTKPLKQGGQLARQQFPAKAKKERSDGAKSIKRRADYFKAAQDALNKWVREVRDRDKPCISCGAWHGEFHAGHFLGRGTRPNLALVELNVAKQCSTCNVDEAGAREAFRRGLVARHGEPVVEMLESDHTPRKHTITDLQAIQAHYLALLKQA